MLIESKRAYNRAIHRFMYKQPSYPVTVNECRKVIRDASIIQQSCDEFGHLESEEDCTALSEVYLVLGATILNCIHNGGYIDIGVRRRTDG